MEQRNEREEPATRRARLRAARRGRKVERRPMAVNGKSVFLIKRLIEERAKEARRKGRGSD